MAWFQRSGDAEEEYTRRFRPAEEEDGEEEEYYDDGFDELLEEDELPEEEYPEEDEEDLRQEKQRKYRIAAGIGDLGATIAGVVVILLLIAYMLNLIRFVVNDFSQNLSLWVTRF